MLKCDAVFAGGGVKGIAFIGAIRETEERGYQFQRVAGTSAGSIMAALLAAGYSGKEMEGLLEELSFPAFLQADWIGRLPGIGKPLNILFRNGMYNTAGLEQWIRDKLIKKGIWSFDDLPEGKLKIIASDITNGRIMIIPDDLPFYGLDPAQFPIARAVRMSCSIPYFFQPVMINQNKKKVVVVDGGLLSNYPIWIFDSKQTPRWPTFGFRLKGADRYQPMKISGPFSMFKAIFTTMMEAHDRRHIEDHDAIRTVFISVENIRATDFHLTLEQKQKLVRLGREEAKRFFDQWSFSNYISRYRRAPVNIKSKSQKGD
ncbi:patatin-like phospholipase family protein [Caldalkalibacillus thermarum TA2.A1]|uniref:Patatin-like phospholipase family protein n=1 Tax=Caldalkalibacillus thermarum (strain TA2.A1) TaxID=986075 RepID=A0A8X8I7X3_CALTT|nr:patatin-like phospholipase family protein [Caldalkalibacillus thermarum]QZT32636.1 patatin-like phospholipase family protein [Caldalkalibacillus thermarum TA2.A1]